MTKRRSRSFAAAAAAPAPPAEPSAHAQRLAAVSEVLRIISRTPPALEEVLSVVLEGAVRLCDAAGGLGVQREGARLRRMAIARQVDGQIQRVPVGGDSPWDAAWH